MSRKNKFYLKHINLMNKVLQYINLFRFPTPALSRRHVAVVIPCIFLNIVTVISVFSKYLNIVTVISVFSIYFLLYILVVLLYSYGVI